MTQQQAQELFECLPEATYDNEINTALPWVSELITQGLLVDTGEFVHTTAAGRAALIAHVVEK